MSSASRGGRNPPHAVGWTPRPRIIVASLCFLAVAAACTRTPSLVTPPGYLRVDIETSPLSFDPRFATDAISSRIDELIFDSLVKLDARGAFIGDLAESIERPTPTQLVFHLRRGARFSDGRQLTARDVKYTYDSVLDAVTISPKRAGLEPLAAIDAPDDYTVRMTTRGPYAPALEMAMLGIVPEGTPAQAAPNSYPVGTGFFRLAGFVRDEAAVLERNRFRPAPGPGIPGVIFRIVPDPTVRALELAKGTADFAENNIQPDLLGYLGRWQHLRVARNPGTAYQYLAFNFRDSRLRDRRVRQAIAFAIDREAIVAAMLRGTARVATGMLTPENWAYEGEVRRYPYDPAQARRLLEEAGFADPGGGKPRMALTYKTTPEGRRLGEVCQAMLAKVGIKLDVRSNEWATFYGDIQHGNFELTSLAWVGINDPHHYYMVFDSTMTPPRGLNRGAYSNAEMDRLLEAGEVALESGQRRAIYAAAQKLAAQELPYLSLWWQDNVTVMNRDIAGFVPYPNGSLRSLATISFDTRAIAVRHQRVQP
jgi:peptide/nickel transport system substrate-binding protein